ncbi:hypothetical protein NL676_000441 [Syzygium grande]|nr:hypothetical protein NL676_000441 [Syzygium grande]
MERPTVVLGGGTLWLNDGEQRSTGSSSGSSNASTSVVDVKSSGWLTAKELTATSLAWKFAGQLTVVLAILVVDQARCSEGVVVVGTFFS